MSALTISASQIAGSLTNAATKYGVPIGTLTGVFGQETTFGQNISTSSAGAVGGFQFTAANKGTGVTYPMTNTPSAAQFAQQADAAAAYLQSLYKQHGNNWNAAIQAYSGGGYGLAQVNAQAAKTPSALKQALGVSIVTSAGATENTVPGVSAGPGNPAVLTEAARNVASSVPAAISNAVSTVTGDAKYAAVMVGVLLLGAMLIFRGFSSSGSSKPAMIPVPA